jgi:hypothetical protein
MTALESLRSRGTTATDEFTTLLDDYNISYSKFVRRHKDTIAELLKLRAISEEELQDVTCEYVQSKNKFGERHYEVIWFAKERLQRGTRDHRSKIVRLARTCEQLDKLNFLSGSILRYRAARDELRKLWWAVLVIPELQSLGVTLHCSDKGVRRRGQGVGRPAGCVTDAQKRRESMQRLRDRCVARPIAIRHLAEEWGVSYHQAALLSKRWGWSGRRGRPT